MLPNYTIRELFEGKVPEFFFEHPAFRMPAAAVKRLFPPLIRRFGYQDWRTVPLVYDLATVLREEGDFDNASFYLGRLLDFDEIIDPYGRDMLCEMLATSLELAGRRNAALREYWRLRQSQPLTYFYAVLRLSGPKVARLALERLRGLHSDHPVVLRAVCDVLAHEESSDLTRAREVLEQHDLLNLPLESAAEISMSDSWLQTDLLENVLVRWGVGEVRKARELSLHFISNRGDHNELHLEKNWKVAVLESILRGDFRHG